jgi:hypothetical protein
VAYKLIAAQPQSWQPLLDRLRERGRPRELRSAHFLEGVNNEV